jgi:glycosyltransferase involved in cell wall biosynthesis
MSHITDVKGVGVLLEAFSRLPKNYQLDVYGAIKDRRYENFDWASHRVSHIKEISSDEALRKLSEYDLLLLPSSYPEGYPGIIIDALSLGIPVIATRVGGIPEIITSGREGLLIEKADVDSIVKAILSVDATNYPAYCENAYRTFCNSFESEKTNNRILSLLIT